MKLIKHKNIDLKKWNACVSRVPKTHFYGLFQYLTNLCTWEAIIKEQKGEYLYVIPLPFKRKLGMKYLYQPFFCQQLGLLGQPSISKEEEKEAAKIIHKNYLFGSFNWNITPSENKLFDVEKQPNYELCLTSDFETLKQNFNSNRKRILKRCAKLETSISSSTNNIAIGQTIHRFQEVLGSLFTEIKSSDYEVLKNGLQALQPVAKTEVYKLHYQDEIIAAVLTVEYNDRIVYLLGYIEEAHRKTGANALLFEEIIKRNATKNKTLDFEGSKSEGIAKFYQSYGAINVPYTRITLATVFNEILKIVR